MARKSNRIWFVALGIFIAVGLFTFLVQRFVRDDEVDAANMAAFDAGYIISDWQMSNYTSMSESQIQSFLNSKGRCGNTNFSGVGTRVGYFSDMTPPTTWHVENGHTVCLAEENINGKSAARIIWEAAQYYRINPQVLIVLLQKETGLITDPIPNSWDYRRATGYGCPDSTPGCSSEYAGFENQIWYAAALFRNVLDNGYSKFPVGGAWVQWSTNSSCGSGWVNIKNRATSALYRYTPYQPNKAALASSYGYGDSCSQYGNRNFYSYFEDWFGGIKDTKPLSSVKIANGTYYIKSVFAPTKAVDVYGAEEEDGTNIQIYKSNNSGAQKWTFTYNAKTDDYTIVNAVSKKAIDVYGAGEDDGTNVQLYQSNNSCAQRWKAIDMGGGKVKFLSACSMKALQAADDSGDNGTNIEISTSTNSDTQEWTLETIDEIEEGLYTIATAKNENKLLDITGGVKSAVSGTNVHLYKKNNTAAQRWYISKTSDGYYTIRNLQTNKLIDVKSGSSSNYANIQIWPSNNACAQKWKALKVDKGYTFISTCSFKVLDLYGGYVDDDTNIQIFEANNSLAQKWVLTPIPILEDGEYTLISGVSDETDMALDLWGNFDDSGTNIQIYQSNLSSAQKWTIKYDKNIDYYRITNTGANKSLDVKSASKESGANVQLWDIHDSCAQEWIIVEEEDYYYIYSSCSNMALDVYGALNENSTNVQVYRANKSKAQKWFLRKS